MPYVEEIPAGTPSRPLATSVTGFVGACGMGPVDTPVTISSPSDYHATFGPSLGEAQPLGHAVDLFFANGGTSAVVVRATGPAPEHLVPEADGGVHALSQAGVTVLVIPGLTAADQPQVSAALTFCEERRAVLLVDLPRGPWAAESKTAAQQIGPHRERAAAYHPWVLVGGVAVPPSGAVAGVIARTDAERGVWKAPAGVELVGVDGFTESLDDAAVAALTQCGVNALREFPGRGRLVWGARTLAAAQSADPAHRYLSVRRLTDHVLGSLAAGLSFAVFEPNDAPLWMRVRTLAESFLRDLWRRGAFQGNTAEEAYGVRCGLGETMTEADVEVGLLIVEVFLATVKPAEFDVHGLRVQAQPRHGAPPVGERVRAVDLSRVGSRYMAETEKNLSRLFDEAERNGEVLLFDEADALFGRRTDVRDSHDRYAMKVVTHLIERTAGEHGVEVRWRRCTS